MANLKQAMVLMIIASLIAGTTATGTTCSSYTPKAIHVTDSTSDGRQWFPVVEKLTDNRLVVAWEDLGNEDNMYRIYSEDLTPLTDAIAFGRSLTMQGSWGWERESVRALNSGGFIMLVSGADSAQFLNGRFEIKIFDSSLNPTHTAVFGAHVWGEPNRSLMEPKIALLQPGGFMVTFRIGHCGMTWSCYAAQTFDSEANPVGDWFYVDGRVRGGDERTPAILDLPDGPWSGMVRTVVSLPNGNVMLVHAGQNAISAGTISVSIWNSHGDLVKPHFLIPDVVATRSHQADHYADAALLSNGNVAVTWTWYQRENADGSGRDQRQLLFQIIDQDGNKIGSNQRVWGPVESTGDAFVTVGGYVMVAPTEGKFTISSHHTQGNYNVFTRTFLNDGTLHGDLVNEMEGLGVSYAHRAVIEYGSQDYVIAVQGSVIDDIRDAQEGIFLIGQDCVPPTTTAVETTTSSQPTARCQDISTDTMLCNGNDCLPGYEVLEDLLACKQAASDLGEIFWGSSPSTPRGCWKYTNPINFNVHIRWNPTDGSNINLDHVSPICRLAPTDRPTTSPTASNPSSSPIPDCEVVELDALDGTFESMNDPSLGTRSAASATQRRTVNSMVTGAGFHNGQNTADSWLAPIPLFREQFGRDPVSLYEGLADGMPASPDGGVFAAGTSSSPTNTNTFIESFWVDILDLEVGSPYTLSFWQANAGFRTGHPSTLTDQGSWEVQFGDEEVLSEPVTFEGFGAQTWKIEEIVFHPTSSTQRLEFTSKFIDGSGSYVYMALDGIQFNKSSGKMPCLRSAAPTMAPSADSVCPLGFAPHGEHGELNLFNHRIGTWPFVDTIELCGRECDRVHCASFEYHTTSRMCATHSVADLDSHVNPENWLACIKEVESTTEPLCSQFVRRNTTDHLCHASASVFDKEIELLPVKNQGWNVNRFFGHYTFTTTVEECEALCDSIDRCVTYGFWAFESTTIECHIYSQENCPLIYHGRTNAHDHLGWQLLDKKLCDDISTTAPVTTFEPTHAPTVAMAGGCDPVEVNVIDGTFESMNDANFGTKSAAKSTEDRRYNSLVTGAGWSNGEGSADTWLAPVPLFSNQFGRDPAGWQGLADGTPESPQGGVFAAALAQPAPGTYMESFWADIPDLEVGAHYTLSFWQTHAGSSATTHNTEVDDIGYWKVTFGDESVDATALPFEGFGFQTWRREQIVFTPTSATQRLEFAAQWLSGTGRWVYVAVDGLGFVKASDGVPCVDSKSPTAAPTVARKYCSEPKPHYGLMDSSSTYHREIVGFTKELGNDLIGNCQNLCELDGACQSWMYDTSENMCALSSDAELNPNMAVPERVTAGICVPAVCPIGFIPHGEHGELNLNNHPVGSWPSLESIESCSTECDRLNCPAFEYDEISQKCATHNFVDRSNRPNPQGWIACIRENGACEQWIERTDYINSICDGSASDFEVSELSAEKEWGFQAQHGWWTMTSNPAGDSEYAECRALCEATERCVTYAFNVMSDTRAGACFLYSQEDCPIVAAVQNTHHKIHDLVVNCLTTTTTTTTESAETTIDPTRNCGLAMADYRPKHRDTLFQQEGVSYTPEFGWELPSTCANLCERTAECQAWMFDTSGNQCLLYSSPEIEAYNQQPGRVTSGSCAPLFEEECPNGNTLGFIGLGFCLDNGGTVGYPAAGYVTRTSKEDCLAQCEANPDCVAAMTAYNYYCSNYLQTDTTDGMLDDSTTATMGEEHYQQWECHAKCFSVRHVGTCTVFNVDNRLPRDSIYATEGVSGNPVDGFYLPSVCAKKCEQDVRCRAWMFDTSGNQCSLGNSPQVDTCTSSSCGPISGRLTAGSCGSTDEEDDEICPRGFIPHGENGELNLNNHPTGSWPQEDSMEECAAFCETVNCASFEYHVPSKICATHTIVDKATNSNPAGWVACILETSEPTPAPSASTEMKECPSGYHQIGDLSTNNDIGGWGMATREDVNTYRTFEECGAMCDDKLGCLSFNWNYEGHCLWYDADVPNHDDGRGYIFCARDHQECPEAYHQVGDLRTNNDIGGYGMATQNDAMNVHRTVEECAEVCNSTPKCLSFNWFTVYQAEGSCVWYDSDTPTGSDGRKLLFCARMTDAPTTSIPTQIPTAMPSNVPTTSSPTNDPTKDPTTERPTESPTDVVSIPYDGPSYFCDTYQDPHVDAWHHYGAHWQDYRIDLDSRDNQLHNGDWLIFEYGAYQVIMSHTGNCPTNSNCGPWNTHVYVKKNGAVVYSYSGKTTERVIDNSEVEVHTNPSNSWVSNVNYAGYGSTYEYELVILRNIPLEITWLQQKSERDPATSTGRHGAILDIALKWDEEPSVTSGVCSATVATYAQYKLGDDIFGTGRRELVQQEAQTCPTLNQCCSRLAGLVNQFESCKLDNHDSCCATAADPASCCGTFVQDTPRCSENSCGDSERCNLIDGYCYPEDQIAAVTAFKGSCRSNVDTNLDLGFCTMESNSLTCDQVITTDECDNGLAYLSKTIGGNGEVALYDSCEFEWYAEYTCAPPVLECPGNFIQVGTLGSDIEGCGLEGCLNIQTIQECKERCEMIDECYAFTFARPQEELDNEFSCTLYSSVAPTRMDRSKIFCKSADAPIVGTVTFEAQFDYVNTRCGEFLNPLEQVVARVARVEVRHIRAEVEDCKTGSFTVSIDVESLDALEPLRDTVENEVFLQRLNHELKNHGKSSSSTLTNVSTSEDDEGLTLGVTLAVMFAFLSLGLFIGCFCKRDCSPKAEGNFDPEIGAGKRKPELTPEISLKSLPISDVFSNESSTLYVMGEGKHASLQVTLREGASSLLEKNWQSEETKQL